MSKSEKINWTLEQEELLNKNKKGLFAVKACPGSGKTFTISKKLYDLVQDWENSYSGIAALSFTNVATEEIKTNYKEYNKNEGISFPHYIGTIDSFLNKYIFLPYGHLVMKCKNRPILVGEPYGPWHGKCFKDSFFDVITYDINGKLYQNSYKKRFKENMRKRIYARKKLFNKKGYATQDDANYFSLQILKKYPDVAKILTSRFPFIIIDEAQDTSDIQMEIVNILIENELKNLIFVGDPNQSIFEWNNAKPQLFNEKFNKWQNSISLTNSFRCSPKIAKFASEMLDTPFEGKNSEKYDNAYEIKSYDNQDYNKIISEFLEECDEKGIKINKKNVAVLVRSNKTLTEIISNSSDNRDNYKDVWFGNDYLNKSYTEKSILGKYYWENGELLKGFNLIENALFLKEDKRYKKREYVTNEIFIHGLSGYRSKISYFINILPLFELDDNIEEWISLSNEILKEHNFPEFTHPKSRKNFDKKFRENFTFQKLFYNKEKQESDLDYYLGNVHSVKGMSFDAVLLIVKARFGRNQSYKKILKNSNLENEEELRIIYVALTRARYLLKIAVPKENIDFWEEYFKISS